MYNLPLKDVIIHCSATPPDWMEGQSLKAKRAEIDRWHRTRRKPFRKIGYHWLIDRNGGVIEGRSEREQGAHVLGMNKNSLGICLIGGHGGAETDRFEDHFTPEQNRGLRDLLFGILERHEKAGAPVIRISGHNEHAAKACPCFRVAEWLAQEPAPVGPIEPEPPSIGDAIAALAARVARLETLIDV